MCRNTAQTADLSMMTELYEFTLADGYFSAGMQDTVACFDLFFRRVPDGGGFAVMAGLEQVIAYLKNLHFTEGDLAFLREKGISEPFLNYLRDFKFACDVWAIPEGTPIFPNEPIVKVRGPVVQAQMIETMLLLCINQQSLIATKANRLVRAAHGTAVAEFGARRAQGTNVAVCGARAAYIGGCVATSGVEAARKFGIPTLQTMIHSWVQMFDSEYEAFCAYARAYPDDCTFVVDTYDTLRSGVPNAIRAFNDVLLPLGKRPKSVRIDSGDITYLSKRVRKMLDEAGYPDCDIMASNSLDEHIISDMLSQGAKVDCFIVGERLITSASTPLFGGVYKLCAVEKDGRIIPKINLSENVKKITIPSSKLVYRLFDMDSGKAIADVLTTDSEEIDDTKPYELFDPDFTWKRKEIENYVARPLLVKIFDKGECVYTSPALDEIRDYCAEQIDSLWDEVKRFENPHKYYVDLSEKLWEIRKLLIEEYKGVRK
ncbi:MAG: nicotinate phosphoribosyltransferase [Candidatus Fimenecus sp.]